MRGFPDQELVEEAEQIDDTQVNIKMTQIQILILEKLNQMSLINKC